MLSHLEKVLRHAERKLQASPKSSSADLLDIYRNFLKVEQHRLRLEHRAGGGGLEISRKRSDLITVLLRHLFKEAMLRAQQSHSLPSGTEHLIALIAIGGFGRGELCPGSDIDIQFIYKKHGAQSAEAKFINDVIQQILYLLWDIGLKLGPASRTIDEVVSQANGDLQTKTSLLETRLVAGSEELFDIFLGRFRRLCLLGREQEYLQWRLEESRERQSKQGNTVFLQEPNVKNGCGSLRDYQNLLWIAKAKGLAESTAQLQQQGHLTATERKQIDQAYDFLLRVRTELHLQQDKPNDLLTLKLQAPVANALGYHQKGLLLRIETFMRDYYSHSRNLFLITHLASRRLVGMEKSPKSVLRSFLPARLSKVEEFDGLRLENGKLYPLGSGIFQEDPLRIARVFADMQKHGAVLSSELQSLISRRSSLASRKFLWLPEVREILTSIMSQKGRVGRVLRAMHETGVLGKLVPEFAPLTCLVQHEFYHRYTADEHTLVCIEQLDKVINGAEEPFSKYRPLFQSCRHPDILYIALLLHDTGKAGKAKSHSDLSTQLAVRFARRMRIGGRRLQMLSFLVDHHMTLSQIAQRRNLDDHDTIREFARIVQDQERLDMLMLLTFVDGQGTGGENNWSDWKEVLVWQLFRRTQHLLQGEEEFLKHELIGRGTLLQEVRKKLPKSVEDNEIAAHFESIPQGYLYPGNIELATRQIGLTHDFLARQLNAESNPLAPVIDWADKPNFGYSEVIVVTWDRDYLLPKIAGAFSLAGLNILSADIFTRGDDIVVDSFRVCTERWESIHDKRDRKALEENLTRSLVDESFDLDKRLRETMARQGRTALHNEAVEVAVGFDNESSSDCTLLFVQAPDSLGLLYRILLVLAEHRIRIVHARVTTEKGAALDTFYITHAGGGKVQQGSELRGIAGDLKRTLREN